MTEESFESVKRCEGSEMRSLSSSLSHRPQMVYILFRHTSDNIEATFTKIIANLQRRGVDDKHILVLQELSSSSAQRADFTKQFATQIANTPDDNRVWKNKNLEASAKHGPESFEFIKTVTLLVDGFRRIKHELAPLSLTWNAIDCESDCSIVKEFETQNELLEVFEKALLMPFKADVNPNDVKTFLFTLQQQVLAARAEFIGKRNELMKAQIDDVVMGASENTIIIVMTGAAHGLVAHATRREASDSLLLAHLPSDILTHLPPNRDKQREVSIEGMKEHLLMTGRTLQPRDFRDALLSKLFLASLLEDVSSEAAQRDPALFSAWTQSLMITELILRAADTEKDSWLESILNGMPGTSIMHAAQKQIGLLLLGPSAVSLDGAALRKSLFAKAFGRNW